MDINKTFGNHTISSIIGSEIRNVFTSSTTTDRVGFDDNSLLFKPVDTKTLTTRSLEDVYMPNGGFISSGLDFNNRFEEKTDRFFSLYANANYAFKNRYIVSGSVRIDQSNLFGTDPEYRYKPFWSTGLKWRVAEEDFFDLGFINAFDIRATYGINGNIANDYGPFDIARRVIHYRAGLLNGLDIINPAISDLRWERTATKNFGLDIRAFNNRLNLNLDYYDKETDDFLATDKADPTLGFANLIRNDARISNKGFEISINTVNISQGNFEWSTLLTFRHNRNRVAEVYFDTELAQFSAGIQNYTGGAALSYWMYDYAGVNNEGRPRIRLNSGEIIDLDGIDYDDDVRDKLSNFDNLINMGSSEPVYTGAFTNRFNYKNLSLSFMLIGSGGHVMMKDSYNGEQLNYNPILIPKDAERAWNNPGDENSTDIPSIQAGGNFYSFAASGYVQNSSKNIVDADYLTLREVILTYALPKNAFKKNPFNNVIFNLRANNVATWVKNKEGIDPEAHGVGVRFFERQPSYSIGLNLSF